MSLFGIAELDIEKARKNCIRADWPEAAIPIGKVNLILKLRQN